MLYIVATPIGNLKDLTLRALEILKDVDYIVCEDTRRTRILLKHHNINSPLISFYEQNKKRRLPQIMKLLEEDKSIALVSDAGLPCIQDPGFLIVRECVRRDVKMSVIPGPESIVSSLAISGLPPSKFVFLGFLPHSGGKRRNLLKGALERFKDYTLIFFESPYRLLKTLRDLEELASQRAVCVVKELTKIHEEVLRGNPGQLYEIFSSRKIKGEYVVLLGPQDYQI